MSHSDDQGLVLPPAIAPLHVVIIPIGKEQEDVDAVIEYLSPVIEDLESATVSVDGEYHQSVQPLQYKIDDDLSKSPGWKFSEWEMKGVPVRIAVGKRDMGD